MIYVETIGSNSSIFTLSAEMWRSKYCFYQHPCVWVHLSAQ